MKQTETYSSIDVSSYSSLRATEECRVIDILNRMINNIYIDALKKACPRMLKTGGNLV